MDSELAPPLSNGLDTLNEEHMLPISLIDLFLL